MEWYADSMPRFVALLGIGGIVLFVFTAIGAEFTALGRHPRIAFVLLLVGPVIALVALLLIGRNPGKRLKR